MGLETLTEIVKMNLQALKSKFKTEGELTTEFKVNKSLRQEDVLSMTLFNLVLKKVVRKLLINPGGIILD